MNRRTVARTLRTAFGFATFVLWATASFPVASVGGDSATTWGLDVFTCDVMRVLLDPDAFEIGGDAKADMLRSCSCCKINVGDASTFRICLSAAMDTAWSDVFSIEGDRRLDLTAVAGRLDALEALELWMLERELAAAAAAVCSNEKEWWDALGDLAVNEREVSKPVAPAEGEVKRGSNSSNFLSRDIGSEAMVLVAVLDVDTCEPSPDITLQAKLVSILQLMPPNS